MKDLGLSPNPFFIKNARNIRKNLEVLKIMLIFANVLPFIMNKVAHNILLN